MNPHEQVSNRLESSVAERPPIFVLCTGQDDNVGDVVLRRNLLDALRMHGILHVYLGRMTTAFVEALSLSVSDVVYTERKLWRRAALRHAVSSRTWFVDKPGEFQVNWVTLAVQLQTIPLVLAVRLRRGRVLRVGLGQRQQNSTLTACFRMIFRLSSLVAWRDTGSLESFRIGRQMPDWGFGRTRLEGRFEGHSVSANKLVLSYRSDRPVLSPVTLSAIRDFARSNGLVTTVVCQVKRDSDRCRWLGRELDAEVIDWPDSVTHADQEALLREVFRDASLVLSDRLHVLIVAMTEGATPMCVVDYGETKVARHLDAISYPGTVADVREKRAAEIVELLTEQLGRRGECARALGSAQRALHEIGSSLASSLPSGADEAQTR